jgi:hypothetical protein
MSVLYRDGLEMYIDPGFGIRVSKTRDGHTVESFKVGGARKYFVTLKDSPHCAHGNTVAEAVADALWKDPARRPSLEGLAETIRKAGKKRKISLSEFRLLTGACAEGCRIAIERAGVSGKPMTAFGIRDKVSKEWGGKLLRVLGWEDGGND